MQLAYVVTFICGLFFMASIWIEDRVSQPTEIPFYLKFQSRAERFQLVDADTILVHFRIKSHSMPSQQEARADLDQKIQPITKLLRSAGASYRYQDLGEIVGRTEDHIIRQFLVGIDGWIGLDDVSQIEEVLANLLEARPSHMHLSWGVSPATEKSVRAKLVEELAQEARETAKKMAVLTGFTQAETEEFFLWKKGLGLGAGIGGSGAGSFASGGSAGAGKMADVGFPDSDFKFEVVPIQSLIVSDHSRWLKQSGGVDIKIMIPRAVGRRRFVIKEAVSLPYVLYN